MLVLKLPLPMDIAIKPIRLPLLLPIDGKTIATVINVRCQLSDVCMKYHCFYVVLNTNLIEPYVYLHLSSLSTIPNRIQSTIQYGFPHLKKSYHDIIAIRWSPTSSPEYSSKVAVE